MECACLSHLPATLNGMLPVSAPTCAHHPLLGSNPWPTPLAPLPQVDELTAVQKVWYKPSTWFAKKRRDIELEADVNMEDTAALRKQVGFWPPQPTASTTCDTTEAVCNMPYLSGFVAGPQRNVLVSRWFRSWYPVLTCLCHVGSAVGTQC